MGHLIANIDRVGKAFCVDAAMALDHHALQAEQYAAVRLVGVELVAQLLERAAGEQIANPRQPARRHGLAQQGEHLARGSLGGLERDIAAEASDTITSAAPLPMPSPSTNPI